MIVIEVFWQFMPGLTNHQKFTSQKKNEVLQELDVLRTRIDYGIKAELIDLVRIKGIGRVRARVLFKNGIRSIEDLNVIPIEKLAKIDKIGPVIAENIKTQLKKIR